MVSHRSGETEEYVHFLPPLHLLETALTADGGPVTARRSCSFSQHASLAFCAHIVECAR